ncbi:MAG TPA: AMP-binding protein, partial [Burkholderiaceae bacterium]
MKSEHFETVDARPDVRAEARDGGGIERRLLDVVESTLRDLQGDARFSAGVTFDSALDRDLGLDSLSRMELLLRTERAFGVDLPEDTLAGAERVRDLYAALLRARPGGAPAPLRSAAAPLAGAAPEAEAPLEATTLLQVLHWHLQAHPDRIQIVHLADGGQRGVSYRELAAGADAIAAGLQRCGLQPRQCVAIMLPTSAEYFQTYLGIIRAGGVPVPIYPPARASQLEEHVVRHTQILLNAQAAAMVTVPEAMTVAQLLRARVPGLRHIVTPQSLAQGAGAAAAVDVRADDIAFIQYTSGSTGNPKGVVLTHANLLANVRAMGRAARAGAEDVFVSWLPLYHDMGLIGAWLGSLYYGVPLVLLSPLSFLVRPERWLWAIHRY